MPKAPPCPRDAATFHRLVNMSPQAIRKWSKDARAKCASFTSTRKRLPRLAALKGKQRSAWVASDCAYAKRVNSFNARMQGMVHQHGCTTRAVTSLLNWGRKPPGCKMPPAGCSTRPPRAQKRKK